MSLDVPGLMLSELSEFKVCRFIRTLKAHPSVTYKNASQFCIGNLIGGLRAMS